MAEQYSSFMSSGTKLFFKFQMPTSGATVEKTKWGTRAHQARVPQKVVLT